MTIISNNTSNSNSNKSQNDNIEEAEYEEVKEEIQNDQEFGPLENFIISRIIGLLADQQEGKIKIPIVEKFFPNGIAFRPKAGRALIINAGNNFDSFILSMKGYCFLYQLLPKKNDWAHEADKWWVVSNPQNEISGKDVIRFLNLFGSNSPILSEPEQDQIVKNKPAAFLPPMEQRIFNETGIVIFQDIGGQKRIGYRPISFKQFTDADPVKDRTTTDEGSPYYVCTYFPYAFEIKDAEDRNLVPTSIQLTIRAKCVNPYISDIKMGNPFNTLNSIVSSTVVHTIRDIAVHEVSRALSEAANPEAPKTDAKTVIDIIKKAIMDELKKDENFIGFAYKDVEIGQVDISGDLAIKLKNAANLVYIAKQDQQAQEIRDITNFNKMKKEKEGEALGLETIARANATVLKIEAEALVEKLNKTEPVVAAQLKTVMKAIKAAGGNPDLYLQKEIIEKYKPGGINVQTINPLELVKQAETEKKD